MIRIRSKTGRLEVRQCSLREANRQVAMWHRHLGPVQGHKISLECVSINGGARDGFNIQWERSEGVAIMGRPTSRHLDDGKTWEVTRVAVNPHTYTGVCSFLLGRCVAVARHCGINRVITYTRQDEDGVTLRAAGFTNEGPAGNPKTKFRWSKETGA